ncbi:MAG: hypothetical protein OEW02_13030 [Myxococcales bacterium]|nr:hypothetical protein [Myxococcales bacterium]MDH5566668.1 hypothetical protein [Myxococcales bacterium]
MFPSIEAAAVDALTYAYLEACATRDIERMRGGTIHPAGGGYSYGEIRVASSGKPHRLEYPLAPQDVARFELYPINGDYDVDRINERASRADRRSVAVVDPLHRPLFILHPSLMVREYHDPVHSALEVADLRQPPREILLADDRP